MQDALIAGGRVYLPGGDPHHPPVDQAAALKQLHDGLAHALSDDEVQRRKLLKALLPHIKRFYAGCMDTAEHQPFYRPSSMA